MLLHVNSDFLSFDTVYSAVTPQHRQSSFRFRVHTSISRGNMWVTEGKITVVEKGRKKISSVCVSKTLAFAWNMKRKDSNLLLLVIWLLQKKTIKSRVMNSRKISVLLTSSSQTGFQTYIMSSLHQFLHQRMLWVLYKLSNYDFAKNKLTPLAPYQPFCGRWVALVSHSCPLSDHSKGSFLLFYGTDC